jgi:hypothetical protein
MCFPAVPSVNFPITFHSSLGIIIRDLYIYIYIYIFPSLNKRLITYISLKVLSSCKISKSCAKKMLPPRPSCIRNLPLHGSAHAQPNMRTVLELKARGTIGGPVYLVHACSEGNQQRSSGNPITVGLNIPRKNARHLLIAP